jgi:pimeloyl-ACP methyl ester carboxylesterase
VQTCARSGFRSSLDGDPALAIFVREIERIEPDGQPFDRARMFSLDRLGDLAWEPDPLPDILSELSVPTVLLHGARDARIPVVSVRTLAQRLPDAALIEFPQAGHDLLRLRGGQVTMIAAAMARNGLRDAMATGERVRYRRPRERVIRLYERWLRTRAARASANLGTRAAA